MNFAREPYSDDLANEFLPLLKRHYNEIAHYKDIPLDPDFKLYAIAAENAGLHIFTARNDGTLCGYAVFFVKANPHYRSSIQAVQDVLFLSPEMRKGFSGARFIKWCNDRLQQMGCQVVYHHVKLSKDFGIVLERMGFELVDKIYAKRLDGWNRE